MYSLPIPPGEDEPTSPERNPTVEEGPFDWTKWAIRFVAVSYAGTVFYRLWTDEMVRAYLLHVGTGLLQSLARHFGGWAINMENTYNDLVSTWH